MLFFILPTLFFLRILFVEYVSSFGSILIAGLLISFILYLSDFNFAFSPISDSIFTISDETSVLLIYITFFVIITSLLAFFPSVLTVRVFISFFSLLVFCVIVFCSPNLVLLYLFFECSIFPIVYIIIKWGVYPDRGFSSAIILIFTRFFTVPLIVLIFYYFESYFSTNFLFLRLDTASSCLPSVCAFWIFFSFSVKLPLYGLHFWLPIAHVEAPTFGSIILAGILLKLGGCGLLRSFSILAPHIRTFNYYILSYIVFSVIISSISCCFQSDFKRLVAYSSVVHIRCVPLLLLVGSPMSLKALLILIVFHGLSSPLIFFLVGLVYKIFNSRLFVLVRGLILISPLLSFLTLLLFLISIPTPPFPPFISEVLIFISGLSLSLYLALPFIIILFISLAYNLYWFSSISFFKPSNFNLNFHFSFLEFFIFSLYLFLLILFVFVMFVF